MKNRRAHKKRITDAAARFRLPWNHAVVGQRAAGIFSQLRLSASLRDGDSWCPIHKVSDMVDVEIAHGVEERRWAYNERCLAKVRREGTLQRGEHAGFYDLFAPVRDASGAWGVLVTGPFAIARPTSSDILARWRTLTGGHGRASDPDFRDYVAMTLAATTFEDGELEVFTRIIERIAEIFAGASGLERIFREVETLRDKLQETRLAERMWEGVRGLVDEHPSGGWLNHWRGHENRFIEMGTAKLPKHVVVGLLAHGDGATGPLDDLLRRDAFHRACVGFARRRTGALCGRIGDHGLVLLVDDAGSGSRLQARLNEVGERARALARRFGLALHLGVSAPDPSDPLPSKYQSALSAAENALTRGLPVVHAERAPRRAETPLGELRRQLVHAVGDNPSLLSSRFDRYLEGIIVRSGYRLELIEAHLEAGFDLLTEQLEAANALDPKSLSDCEATLQKAAAHATTVRELSAVYRGVVADIELAMQKPRDAGQDRSIRRAVAFVRDHFAEPLRLSRVARIAGFAPGYFSKLFAANEQQTFREYLKQLRMERAKQMLTSTRLSAERVGTLSGLGTRSRFHVAFREAVGMTPLEYRKRNPPASIYLPVPRARSQTQNRR